MVNVEGKEYYGIGIDNSELKKDANQSKSLLKGIGNAAEAEGARIDKAFKNAAAGAAAFFSLQQAGLFVKKIMDVRGEFQKLEVSFNTMLGSKQKADALMQQLIETAAITPFDLQGVANGAKQLLAYGDSVENVNDDLIRLGNIAAGLSQPLGDIVYLYGTTMTQGRLYTADLNQFTGRGIPMIKELAKQFGVAENEVKGLVESGKVGFPEVQKVIQSLTNEGGMFFNLMEEQSKTISGKIANIGDAIDTMFNNIGKQSEGAINDTLSGVNYLIEHYEEIGRTLGVLVATYGAYRAALIAVIATQRSAALASNITAWFQLAKGVNSAKDAQILFNLATKANPWVLAATAIVALGTAMWAFGKKAKTTADYVKEFNDEIDRQKKEYSDSLSVLTDENAAIADRQKALITLRTIQPEIYENMTLEEAAAINLTKATRELNMAYDEQKKKKLEEERDAYKQQIGFKQTAKGKIIGFDRQSERKLDADINYYTDKVKILDAQIDALNQSIEETKTLEAQAAEEAKKKAQAEIQTLETLKKKKKDLENKQEKVSSKEEYVDIEKQKQAVQKQIEAITGKSKQAEKELRKTVKELTQMLLESELDLQSAKIAAMKDGKDKRVLLANQEYKEKLVLIDKEKQAYLDKMKGAGKKADPKDLQVFEDKKTTAKDVRNRSVADINKDYSKELSERYKSLTDVFVGEEQRKLSAIKERYDKERQWAKEQYETGGMDEDQYKTYTVGIDNAQVQESYKTLLSGLNDYKQQEAELNETWDARIKAAKDANDTDLVARMQIGKDKALSALNSQMLQESEEWQQLFGDLDNLTVSQIDNLVSLIESKAKDLNLNPVDLKEVTNSLNQAKQKVIEINPFGELGKSFKTVFSSGAKDSKKSKDDIKKDWKDLAKSTEGCFDFVNDAVASCSVLGDILGDSGQQIIGMIQGVATAGIAMAAAIKTAESASVVLAAISLALTAVTALFSLFNGDKKKEKEIKRLQDQVNALEKSYDSLGRAIEKAYSHDASQLIEQQNKNLLQQNAVIRKQIEAERSKKKSDKDKIKEWENTIEENNRIIEDNKDKAVDAIFGSDVQSAIDDFASAYLDAWAAGEDRIKSQKDVVKGMIKGVVAEMLKSDLAPTVAKLREKIQKALADNVITDSEQAEIDALVEAATKRADTKYASLDKYLKDADEKETRSAQAQGIATASQESVDKNNGLLANVQFYVAKATGLLETAIAVQAAAQDNKTNPLLSVTVAISDNMKAITQQLAIMLKHLAGIETNTSYCKKLESIDKNINNMKGNLDDINTSLRKAI